MTITCPGCNKPFTFDPATTENQMKLRLSRSGSSTITYYPTCPHCGKRNVVTKGG